MIRKILIASTILSVSAASPAFAENEALAQRVLQLEQELAILKRQLELDKEEKVTAQTSQPAVEYKKGLTVTTADKRAQIGLRGYAQVDGRFFLDDDRNTGRDEFIARRLRPIIFGKVDDFSFRLMPDFAGGTTRAYDAHIDYKFYDAFQLRAGKFKPPLGLERLQSGSELAFMERGLTANLSPSRDFGVQAYGDVESMFEYQLGVFNGNADLGNTDNDDDDNKDVMARVFLHPFHNSDQYALKDLGIGIAGSVGEREGSTGTTILSDYRSPGQQRIFRYRSGAAADTVFADGTHWRLNPQANYYYGPLGFLTEYLISHQEVQRGAASTSLEHTAWQAYVSYVLTGEDASFKGVKPKENFNPMNDGWGAFEVAGRVGQISFDDDAFPLFADPSASVSDATSFGAGINWYLNEMVRMQLNYDLTQFDGGAAGGRDRDNEHALFSRIQYQF